AVGRDDILRLTGDLWPTKFTHECDIVGPSRGEGDDSGRRLRRNLKVRFGRCDSSVAQFPHSKRSVLSNSEAMIMFHIDCQHRVLKRWCGEWITISRDARAAGPGND